MSNYNDVVYTEWEIEMIEVKLNYVNRKMKNDISRDKM